jgi:hypothetical protein
LPPASWTRRAPRTAQSQWLRGSSGRSDPRRAQTCPIVLAFPRQASPIRPTSPTPSPMLCASTAPRSFTMRMMARSSPSDSCEAVRGNRRRLRRSAAGAGNIGRDASLSLRKVKETEWPDTSTPTPSNCSCLRLQSQPRCRVCGCGRSSGAVSENDVAKAGLISRPRAALSQPSRSSHDHPDRRPSRAACTPTRRCLLSRTRPALGDQCWLGCSSPIWRRGGIAHAFAGDAAFAAEPKPGLFVPRAANPNVKPRVPMHEHLRCGRNQGFHLSWQAAELEAWPDLRKARSSASGGQASSAVAID